MLRMAHRKWKETKLQPRSAGPGNMLGCCCLVSFHFLWANLRSTSTVVESVVAGKTSTSVFQQDQLDDKELICNNYKVATAITTIVKTTVKMSEGSQLSTECLKTLHG